MQKNYPQFNYFCFFIFLFFTAFSYSQHAEISVTTVSPSPACAGDTVTLTLDAKNGDKSDERFTNITEYTVYLSSNGGSTYSVIKTPFTISASYCTTINCTTSITTTVTIPSSAVTGNNYTIAILSTNPEIKFYRRSTSFTVNALPTQPIVGTITQPTCTAATGSVALSGLPASGTWTIYPGGITGTGTSTTISNLAPGTYSFTVTNAAGCTSPPSSVVISPILNYWIGTSSVWNDPANWSRGVVPNNTNDLINIIPVIADATKVYPVITFGMGVTGAGITGTGVFVKNLEIQSRALLTINDNSLNVTTCALTLNGKIDLNSDAQLVQWDGSTVVGTGTIEIDQQGTGDSFSYNYWSSPVNSTGNTYSIGAVLRDGTDPNAIIKPIIAFGAAHTWADGAATSPIRLSTYWMYKLENSKGYAAWTRIGNNISIKAGEGYTMKGSNTTAAEQNYTFVGQPNNGDITLPIAVDNDYLIGNPYPSAIDAYQFIDDNLAHTGPLYFWEHSGGGTHNLAGYQGGYATLTKSGGVAGSSPGGQVAGVGTNAFANKVPGQYIPVGQAFFVVGEIVGQIQFKNSQRDFVKESLGVSVFMKSSNTKSKPENIRGADLRPKFRIGFDAPKISHRQLLLTIDEKATPAIDRGYEAEIYEVFVDDFYWMLDGKKYVIQATNNIGLNSEVPLGIQLSKTGFVTVKIDALENVDDDTSIYLKDKITGESINMREKPVQLNLEAGKYLDRFVLIFKTQKLVAEDVVAEMSIPAVSPPIIEGIHVFMNNALGELQIKNNSSDEILRVVLINSLGQTVKTWNSNFNIRTISLPVSAATGVYHVQITTKNGSTVKKIMVE